MKNKKAKVMTLLATAMIMGPTACSSNGGNSPTSAPATDSPKPTATSSAPAAANLSIMWWGTDARHEATLAATEIYTKQNPHITFSPDYMAWDAFWQKLPALAASKTVTDVLQMDAAYINDYVSRGVLEDLSDIDLAGVVDPVVIENLKIGGKLYGVPLSMNAQGVAFNKTELEQYGIAVPQKNWTWDDYFKFARDAKAKLPDGKYGINDYSNAWDWYNWYQTGNGEKPLMSPDGKVFTLNKELFTKYHSTFAELRKDKVIPPADQVLSFVENDPQADPMASGVTMTRQATTGSVAALEQLMPGHVDVVGAPTGSAGGGWAQSTIFLSVSTNSEKKEEAKQFVKWFITDKEAGEALRLTRGIPINPDTFAALEPTLEPKDILGKKVYDMALEKALPFYPVASGYSEWVDAYKTTAEALMFGQISIDEAYDRLFKLGEEIASKN